VVEAAALPGRSQSCPSRSLGLETCDKLFLLWRIRFKLHLPHDVFVSCNTLEATRSPRIDTDIQIPNLLVK
jgi:hypothetical protein